MLYFFMGNILLGLLSRENPQFIRECDLSRFNAVPNDSARRYFSTIIDGDGTQNDGSCANDDVIS